MRITIYAIGQKHEAVFDKAIAHYANKIRHYFKCQWEILPAAKLPTTASPAQVQEVELATTLKAIASTDKLVVLDERGRNISSIELAQYLEKAGVDGTKHLGLLIGGAYGVHPQLLREAHFVWSLSNLVFPHQLVRVILSEQLYRAGTILRNEKYHHA